MIITRYMDLPLAVYAFTREDADGNYNVYINTRYCAAQQQISLQHELQHIANGDFDSPLPAHIKEQAIIGNNRHKSA